MRYLLILLILNISSYPVYAQDINENQYKRIMSMCNNVKSFTENNIGNIKRINEKAFVYYSINNDKICPENCITNKYLVINDIVLTGINYNNFTCILYKKKNNNYISGWVKSNYLSPINNRKYDKKELSGYWIAPDPYRYLSIEFSIINDQLHMLGGSSFKINNDNNLRDYYSEGDLDYNNGVYKINNEDSECEYELYLYGEYLSVIDLGKCLPGDEFSLSGIYKRNNSNK